MFNVLIIDNNVEEAKNILNQIVKKYKNLRITGIATNTKEMLNFLNHKDNDLIILIYPFSDISIDFIFKKHKNYKVNSFIVFFNSNNKVWLKKLNNNPYVYKLLYDCNKINSLINSISNFIYTDYISLNRKILQELLLLRFNPSYKGTKYLLDIITIIYKDPLLSEINLQKNIYPKLAQKYNTSTNNIKCNITQSVTCMYYDCPEDIILKYFSYVTLQKPTTKEVILTILNKL